MCRLGRPSESQFPREHVVRDESKRRRQARTSEKRGKLKYFIKTHHHLIIIFGFTARSPARTTAKNKEQSELCQAAAAECRVSTW